jgi:hypothetical protein
VIGVGGPSLGLFGVWAGCPAGWYGSVHCFTRRRTRRHVFGHAAPAWGQDSVVCESVGISKLRCARRLVDAKCRVAGKIDRKRRDTLTSSRRVARACQSWLHGRRPRPCLRLPVRVFLSFDQETVATGRSMALHPFAVTELRSARTDFVTRSLMRASSVAARLIFSRPCISPSETAFPGPIAASSLLVDPGLGSPPPPNAHCRTR